MLRSLFAGVTGLTNHQLKLDVIGNNIANINTLGFKASRVTFREMLTQTISGASRPSDGIGGTNPQQIGLGSSVGSIDTDFSQGNMQITGIMTDLAIEGDGFFILSDGYTQHYTRGGAFTLDGSGFMVNPGNGYKLQGILANDYGVIQQGQGIEDIAIPTSMIVPARATSEIRLTGNLPVESDSLCTITRSEPFMAASQASDLLMSLYNESGTRVGLREGEEIMISADVGGTHIETSFTIDRGSSIQDLLDSLQAFLGAEDAGITVDLNANGQIEVTANTDQIANLSLQVSGNTVFNNAFLNDDLILAGETGTTNDALRAPATSDDLLENLYSGGLPVGISGDLTIGGDLGATKIDSSTLEFVPGVTTLGDLAAMIDESFRITFGSVEIDDLGRMIITGDVGSDREISNIDISSAGENLPAFSFSSIQNASDGGSFDMTSMIYDSLGTTHTLTLTFTKIDGENAWNWDAAIDGVGEILSGGSGIARFTSDGLLSSFSISGTAEGILIDLHNEAENLAITIDPGEIGATSSLSQFNASFSGRMNDMDGMAMGTLETVSIDRNGVINGQFSNGTNRDLAQIAMGDFNNPSGLNRVGENMFIASPNSGMPNLVFAGTNARGMITPGELEMSNVDLAGEFTEMIIAQRGFQANARIISVGDQMLTELVNLKK
ncbi:MAG: flagellar hook-basal body complex protein [Candidatus Krumholzibacteriota bacterium]|nr:flagellar hook-basal body complex protein [Candidatus Krumholzibacteriota bacterium]